MEEKKENQILWCVIFAIVYVAIYKIGGTIFDKIFGSGNVQYLQDAIYDVIVSIILYFVIKKLNQTEILTEKGKGFWYGIKVAGFLIVIMTVNIFATLSSAEGKVQPMFNILVFILYMIGTGVVEEFVFRGIIQNRMYKVYGTDTRKGVIKSVIVSGLIFGMAHLTNAFSGMEFKGVFLQALATFGMGMYFGAIYYRCGNIYALIAIHAFNDFANLIASGIYGAGDISTEVANYSLATMGGLILYGGLALFLLRKSKVADKEENIEQ